MSRSRSRGPVRLIARGWSDYELLDSGGGARLERFGAYRLVRPAPEAAWERALGAPVWDAADAVFSPGRDPHDPARGRWHARRPLPERWPIAYRHLRFWAQPTAYGHIGVFPEQAPHWDWLAHRIAGAARAGSAAGADGPVNVLNLFAYTGLATLAAAAAGARVTHVDASRKTVAWARENQALSGLEERPIRWIVDDALAFVRREARRRMTYDAVLLDPPPFGHGPRGETWRLESSLPDLLAACAGILSNRPLFLILTVYATRRTESWLRGSLEQALGARRGTITLGEATLPERSTGRLLPAATFAHWDAG
jgi:23S rRNA (cytosine1962-C5)-methyltransferase